MKIIYTVSEMQQFALNNMEKQVGFVPTMGFLHEGHMSLMEKAREENEIVVASIFVNPLQFGPNDDFDQYPRDEAKDSRKAKDLKVDVLFIPDVNTMYPKEMLVQMTIEKRANALCGKSRPGHFDGVLTVLSKLFNIVLPNRAYFGMKDAQQLAIVSALVNDLNYPLQIIGLPTVRERDGLAMSSRNVHLSDEERLQTLWLHKALTYGQQMIFNGEKDPNRVVKKVKQIISDNTPGIIDYVELLSYPNLNNVEAINRDVILAVAVKFEKARLIDNIIFNKNGSIINRVEKWNQ